MEIYCASCKKGNEFFIRVDDAGQTFLTCKKCGMTFPLYSSGVSLLNER